MDGPIEFDRVVFVRQEAAGYVRSPVSDEAIVVDAEIDHDSIVSIRGRFVSTRSVEVLSIHDHSSSDRDKPTILGLIYVFALVVVGFFRARLARR